MNAKAEARAAALQPVGLEISIVDEDPGQPRMHDNPGFADKSLHELAESIRNRGVKTPISVRENPVVRGRYIINHGARRFRSSRIAGKTTIPAYVDNDYSEADQVIENLHRNALTPREVANFIGRELAKGLKKSEIAQAISKSPAFVTQHANLLDLPDVIADAFRSGRAKDVTVVSELLIAYKKYAIEVSEWLRDESQEITRGAVKRLREYLNEINHRSIQEAILPASEPQEDVLKTRSVTLADDDLARKRLKKPSLRVVHLHRSGRLLLYRLPTLEAYAWLRYDDTAEEEMALLDEIKLISLREEND
jgi:ParB family chromosome partitioning protein